jgi:hypothetical protein
MYNDPEITAMSKVLEAFVGLQNDQRRRIIEWITSKFGLSGYDQQTAVMPVVDRKAVDTYTYPEPGPAAEPLPLPRAEKPVVEEAGEEEEEPLAVETAASAPDEEGQEDKKVDLQKGLGLKRYRSIETLFLSSNVKTVASKILLAAAYLQEKLSFEEISGFDINSRLKKMGYGVANISTAMNPLLRKKPPLIIQIKKAGDSKQARRKFRVTEEGLIAARSYLRGKGKSE